MLKKLFRGEKCNAVEYDVVGAYWAYVTITSHADEGSNFPSK